MAYRSNLDFSPGRGNFLHPTISQTDFFERITNETQDQIVVNVGSGNYRQIPHAINVDFQDAPEVDVVCSAYNLSFEDNSVDFVISLAMLEHLRYPAKAIAEFKRILKPGGKIYCEVPFIFPLHPSPEDFWRTSVEGLCTWLEDFEKIESGFCSGPSSAFSVFLHKYLSYIQPEDTGDVLPFIPLIKGMIKYVDDYMIFKNTLDVEKANELACAVFFYGRKPENADNKISLNKTDSVYDQTYFRNQKNNTYLESYKNCKSSIQNWAKKISLKKFAIYGTGDLCELFISALGKMDPQVIIDRDPQKWGSKFHGVPVAGIADIDKYGINEIIIASFAHKDVIYEELSKVLQNKNIRIITPDF